MTEPTILPPASPPVAPANAPLEHIRCVLVGTTHTGNLGSAARAMKTMGLKRLELVSPRHPPDAQSMAQAAGADDLLQRAGIHADLVGALTGCRLVIGTSARPRSLAWPLLEPPAAARLLLAEAALGEVALVFGRENSGLTNDELGCCHHLVQIPTEPGFSSLNLAAAVQVLAYEVRRAWREGRGEQLAGQPREVASAEDLAGLHTHLAQTLHEIGFGAPDQSTRLLMRLRQLFNRARPDRLEINILRGILSAAQGRKRTRRPAAAPAADQDPKEFHV
jgi:tRNA (cytidine32/uridine32-2'-O)-methyltransferase